MEPIHSESGIYLPSTGNGRKYCPCGIWSQILLHGTHIPRCVRSGWDQMLTDWILVQDASLILALKGAYLATMYMHAIQSRHWVTILRWFSQSHKIFWHEPQKVTNKRTTNLIRYSPILVTYVHVPITWILKMRFVIAHIPDQSNQIHQPFIDHGSENLTFVILFFAFFLSISLFSISEWSARSTRSTLLSRSFMKGSIIRERKERTTHAPHVCY